MGNSCGSKPSSILDSLSSYNPPPPESQRIPTINVGSNDGFHNPKHTDEFNKYLKEFQEDNFRRLKHTFDYDMNMFLLNNTLMCIQFYDNFDRSLMFAKDFKREKEAAINEKLSTVLHEGIMAGERTVVLMHGMGEILNKNYIYRREKQELADNEVYDNLEAIYRQKSTNSSYLCEGILPLDYFVNFDNYKVYTESEWRRSEHNDYSSVIGDPPLVRMCMEEPGEQNKIPRGFVRLHCEEMTRAGSLHLTAKGSKFEYDYSPASEYGFGGSDTKSYISGSSIPSDDYYSDRGSVNISPGQRMLLDMEKKISNTKSPYKYAPPPKDTHNDQPSISNSSSRVQSPSESFSAKSYQAGLKKSKVNGVPDIRVHEVGRTEMSSETYSKNPFAGIPVQMKKSDELRLPSSARGRGKSTQSNQKYTSPPESVAPPPGEVPSIPKAYPSSGYESLSASSSAISRTSSGASAEVPSRRRPLELKGLWEYTPKQKPLLLPGQSAPKIPPDCLIEVKIEKTEMDGSDHSDEDDDDDDDSQSHATSLTQESDYIIRSYINSTQVSANFCSDLITLLGKKIGIEKSSLDRAQVLGCTVRCTVSQEPENDDIDKYKALQTFTPTVRSKHWTMTSELWFKQRLLPRSLGMESSSDRSESMSWLTRLQVESVIGYGCNMIPQGFRSMEFFNAHQSLEWQLNFCQAENFLLNTFKNIHWRTYIFSSIIFRAFIAPLGPKGVGLEHVRNVIYKMCEEDFLFWNDEEPGSLLRRVLDKLYDSLGKRHLGNFFIDGYDMLRSSAPENTRLVQAILKRIRGNLINHCIHCFRNLTCLQDEDKFYPTADFKQLYKLITSEEQDLFYILHPNTPRNLESDMNNNQDAKPDKKGKNKKQRKKRPQANDDMFQNLMFQYGAESDKKRDMLRKQHERYTKQQNEIRRQKRELKRAEASMQTMIPQMEKRKSIDLEKSPVSSYSNLRKVMIIKFYVQHFLQMAHKAVTFTAFAQATMYTLHVENLCQLMKEMDLGTTPIDIASIEEYLRQAKELRDLIGPRLGEYVKSKLPPFELPDGSSTSLVGSNSAAPSGATLMDNFFMHRKLPTPPRATTSRNSSMRRFDTSGVGSSLFHFPKESHIMSPTSYESSVHEEFEIPGDSFTAPVPPRRQNVKYVQENLHHGFIPSSTRFPRGSSFRNPPRLASTLHENAAAATNHH